MFVERRKDNYDELQILAGDVRTRRRRTNIWTTTMVLGTMGATAAYVATTNSQVDALKAENTSLTINLRDAERDRDKAQTERDVYLQYVNQFGDMYPTLKMGDAIRDITIAGAPGSVEWPPLTISNLVWYVDGSRRFPMAAGDVLWIPEGSVWVRLEFPAVASQTPTEITIHKGAQPAAALPPTTSGSVIGPIALPKGKSYGLVVKRASASCAKLQLEESRREGFGSEYVDMVLTFSTESEVECVKGNQ